MKNIKTFNEFLNENMGATEKKNLYEMVVGYLCGNSKPIIDKFMAEEYKNLPKLAQEWDGAVAEVKAHLATNPQIDYFYSS